MLAFHNTTVTKTNIVAQLKAHKKADEFIKGTYWEDGKGCAVGCTIHSDNHVEYETRFGIPQALARLEDTIFEGLTNGKAKEWPLKFMQAIKPNSDLSLVQWKFLLWLQKENLKTAKKDKMPSDVIEAIQKVILVLDAPAVGKKIDESAARSAAESAWSAAESARSAESAWSARSAAESARSAAESARSAAESAWSAWSARSAAESARSAAESAWSAWSAAESAAAYEKMSAQLIKLIKAAPVKK